MARVPRGGRRKIELKLIENEHERAVTLSKRHDGLFKKACELATLCGAQIAIILFTVSGKPLSFGSPSVTDVVKKFLDSGHGGDQQEDVIKESMRSYRHAKLQELNHEFDEFNEKSINDKKHTQTLEDDVKVLLGGKTYEDYKSCMGIDKLLEMKCRLEEMKRELLVDGCDVGVGSMSLNDEVEVDLSKVEARKDYLKL